MPQQQLQKPPRTLSEPTVPLQDTRKLSSKQSLPNPIRQPALITTKRSAACSLQSINPYLEKKPRLKNPNQHPQPSHLRKILQPREPDRQNPPATQQERRPPRGSHVAFHDVVGGDFEESVGGCEQGDCDGVLVVGHVGLLEEGGAGF